MPLTSACFITEALFLVKSRTSALATMLLKCRISRISELLDTRLKEFCCSFKSAQSLAPYQYFCKFLTWVHHACCTQVYVIRPHTLSCLFNCIRCNVTQCVSQGFKCSDMWHWVTSHRQMTLLFIPENAACNAQPFARLFWFTAVLPVCSSQKYSSLPIFYYHPV